MSYADAGSAADSAAADSAADFAASAVHLREISSQTLTGHPAAARSRKTVLLRCGLLLLYSVVVYRYKIAAEHDVVSYCWY